VQSLHHAFATITLFKYLLVIVIIYVIVLASDSIAKWDVICLAVLYIHVSKLLGTVLIS